jgi:hypothetical protein
MSSPLSSPGLLVSLLDTIDTAVYKLCPFVAAGVVLGSMYWCAVTYGAVTVMVVSPLHTYLGALSLRFCLVHPLVNINRQYRFQLDNILRICITYYIQSI